MITADCEDVIDLTRATSTPAGRELGSKKIFGSEMEKAAPVFVIIVGVEVEIGIPAGHSFRYKYISCFFADLFLRSYVGRYIIHTSYAIYVITQKTTLRCKIGSRTFSGVSISAVKLNQHDKFNQMQNQNLVYLYHCSELVME